MTKQRTSKRLTFEFARGWQDHFNEKPFDVEESGDWQAGWYSRQTHYKYPGRKRMVAE